jgi:hypothetical protein
MLFYACDRDPRQSAIAMADRHIEAAPDFAIRVVAAFMHELGYPFPEYPAPPSYALPLVKTAVECENFRTWFLEWSLCVASEYTFRFGAEHREHAALEDAFYHPTAPPTNLTWALAEIPVLADAEFAHENDVFTAYRDAMSSEYAAWAAAGNPPRWTRCHSPHWMRFLVRLGRAA